jgi:four helix bundle protein
MARTFRDLIVWQKAHKFALSVYRFTEGFPGHEVYGLSAQFRRAAVSVAANIAEGFRKSGRLDKIRFMKTAQGSLEECRYYLILSQDLGYGSMPEGEVALEEVSRLLEGYLRGIKNSAAKARPGVREHSGGYHPRRLASHSDS